MSSIIKHQKTVALVIGIFAAVVATSALVSYWTGSARAGGLPTINPLYYSGFLTDATGKPLTGKRFIGVVLWDAATGGKQKCTTVPTAMNLKLGRFRLSLDKTCVAVIQDISDLWVEVVVDGTSMGRTKIGAVPYVATIPDTFKVSGDATFTVHSNTDTPAKGKKMLALKTGKTIPGEVFSVDNQGQIGIGTTKQVCKLHIESKGAGEHFQIRNGSHRRVDMGETAGGQGYLEVRGSSDALNIRLDGTGASYLNGGKVGVGTNAPAEPLHVNGNIRVTASAAKIGAGNGGVVKPFSVKASTTPMKIADIGHGGLFLISGTYCGTKGIDQFSDLVWCAYNNEPVVLQSATVAHSPPKRTYKKQGGYSLLISLSAGKCDVFGMALIN